MLNLGTGKSLLGAQIAAKFAHMNKDGGGKEKVLYVGPSNKSVDVAAGGNCDKCQVPINICQIKSVLKAT